MFCGIHDDRNFAVDRIEVTSDKTPSQMLPLLVHLAPSNQKRYGTKAEV